MKLKGRHALITGSVGGIGHATAKALAEDGCDVMLHGLADPAEAETIRAALAAATGVKVGFHGADLAVPEQIEELFAHAETTLGAIDILVNNAVVRHYAPIEDFPLESWSMALAVNLTAPFHLSKLAMRGMKARGWGRIVNMSSNYGQTAVVNRVDYCATKAGILGLTRAVALEGLPHGITCNAICPGATLTPHAERQLAQRAATSNKSREELMAELLAERQPSRRFVRPEDVASLIHFLCGDSAREMTGTPISIDGGWLAQ
jgi:3-hydroxybutyrate dehydrogenase